MKVNPLVFLNNLINKFKFKIPKKLPSMSSMLVGYFSYDIIRYIENIPNRCVDDLKIPDVRIMRPKNLIIYDNLEKKIFYIENFYYEKNTKNLEEKYHEVRNKLNDFMNFESIILPRKFTFMANKNKIKSNISKKNIFQLLKLRKNTLS